MIKKDGGKAYSYIVDMSNRWDNGIYRMSYEILQYKDDFKVV